jgi:uncharacterized protein (DUF1501 family)
MISRRDFLKDSLAVVSVGLAVPTVFSKAIVAAAAEKSSASVSGKTLVIVQMAGGVDGLNTVIPYSEGAYRRHRPTLAIPEREMIVVDDRTAFHPSMGLMKELFDQGKMAVIEGVGYPNPDFSHFKSMDIWQTADLDGVSHQGWLGRYFDALIDADGHPLTGLSIGRRLPSAFKSPKGTVPSLESLETFGLQNAAGDRNAAARQTSLLRLYDVYRPLNARFGALLDTTLDKANQSALDLSEAHEAYQPSATYPDTSLASGMRLLAELIHSNDSATGHTPLRIGHVMIGGFDTHTQQPGNLARLLTETSEAIHAFWQDIEGHGHAEEVIVMTWSEFGRRVPENAQAGTDHGTAGPMFLFGNKIKGGFYGERPSLASLENGNLNYTTDFRSVYATVLEGWLEAPSRDVLGDRFDTLNVFAA